MKIKLDENPGIAAADLLRAAGRDCDRAARQGCIDARHKDPTARRGDSMVRQGDRTARQGDIDLRHTDLTVRRGDSMVRQGDRTARQSPNRSTRRASSW